jgi:hypothetical protein
MWVISIVYNMKSENKRIPLIKGEDDLIYMTEKNLQICNKKPR